MLNLEKYYRTHAVNFLPLSHLSSPIPIIFLNPPSLLDIIFVLTTPPLLCPYSIYSCCSFFVLPWFFFALLIGP